MLGRAREAKPCVPLVWLTLSFCLFLYSLSVCPSIGHLLVCISVFYSSVTLSVCPSVFYPYFYHLFIQFICLSMVLKQTRSNLGRVFNSRLGRVCVYSKITCVTKRPNFKLKTWSKQLLGSPPLAFALVSLSFYFSLHPSVYMFLYLSVFLFVHPSVCMSFHVSNCTSVHLSICLFTTFLPVCMSVHMSVHLNHFQEAKLHANTTYDYLLRIRVCSSGERFQL